MLHKIALADKDTELSKLKAQLDEKDAVNATQYKIIVDLEKAGKGSEKRSSERASELKMLQMSHKKALADKDTQMKAAVAEKDKELTEEPKANQGLMVQIGTLLDELGKVKAARAAKKEAVKGLEAKLKGAVGALGENTFSKVSGLVDVYSITSLLKSLYADFCQVSEASEAKLKESVD